MLNYKKYSQVFKNKSLAYKFSAAILSVVLVIFFLILFYNYSISRKLILKNVQENTKNLTSSAINKSEGFFKVIEKITENVSYLIRDTDKTDQELKSILLNVVKNNNEIYGSCMAYAPHKFKPEIEYFAPYFYKKGVDLLYENLANGDYFYPNWDWYKNPVAQGKSSWSEPYYDKGGGNKLMTTYSVPVYKQDTKSDSIIGILTADVSLSWLEEVVSQIKIFETGFAFLISQKGTIITHPDTSYVMKESIFSLAEKLQDKDLKKIGEEMIAGHEDFVRVNSGFHKSKSWIYYTHLKNNDWSLGFVFPENELYADLYKLNNTLVIIAVSGMLLLLILIIIVSKRITRPLHSLAIVAEELGTGNLNVNIPMRKSNDEVGQLNKSFIHMQSALKEYIKNLKQTTSAKEKIESELKIARDIQMGMIPRNFPAFPDRKELEIFGFIEPAKEVGGDLYDFFFIDHERLCFAIGDVAGKGTPAALFMAITMTILRAETQVSGLEVSKAIELMNNYLCKKNESNLFVTLFMGVMNTATGEIEYVNAGHNYPFVIRNDGSITELNKTHCIPLGISVNSCRNPEKITLGKGDTIFMYTDGISEAFNTEDQQYSIKRISETLNNAGNNNPKNIVNIVVNDVVNFSKGRDQSDDMTILAIKFKGNAEAELKQEKFHLKIKNSPECLASVSAEITNISQIWEMPPAVINKLNLVTEELVLNIISYGFTDQLLHEIVLDFSIKTNSIQLTIIDDGKEFDPIAKDKADTSSEINTRKVGGLGIHLVKNLTNSFTYKRQESNNITTIVIHY